MVSALRSDRAERSKKATTKAFEPIEISSDDEDEDDGSRTGGDGGDGDDDDDDEEEEDDNEATPVAKPRANARR